MWIVYKSAYFTNIEHICDQTSCRKWWPYMKFGMLFWIMWNLVTFQTYLAQIALCAQIAFHVTFTNYMARLACYAKRMPIYWQMYFMHKFIFNLIRELYRKCRKRAFQTHFRHAIATFLITFSCEFRAVCGHFGIKSSYIIRHASLFDICSFLAHFAQSCQKCIS